MVEKTIVWMIDRLIFAEAVQGFVSISGHRVTLQLCGKRQDVFLKVLYHGSIAQTWMDVEHANRCKWKSCSSYVTMYIILTGIVHSLGQLALDIILLDMDGDDLLVHRVGFDGVLFFARCVLCSSIPLSVE